MRQVLPSKHTPLRRTLLGQGTLVLGVLSDAQMPVAMLYAQTNDRHPDDFDYPTFVLVLEFLFMIEAIELNGTAVRRAGRDAS